MSKTYVVTVVTMNLAYSPFIQVAPAVQSVFQQGAAQYNIQSVKLHGIHCKSHQIFTWFRYQLSLAEGLLVEFHGVTVYRWCLLLQYLYTINTFTMVIFELYPFWLLQSPFLTHKHTHLNLECFRNHLSYLQY